MKKASEKDEVNTTSCIIVIFPGSKAQDIIAPNADVYVTSGSTVGNIHTSCDVWVEDDVSFAYIAARNVHLGNANNGWTVTAWSQKSGDNVEGGNIQVGVSNRITALEASGDIFIGVSNRISMVKSYQGDVKVDAYNTFEFIEASGMVEIGCKNGILQHTFANESVLCKDDNVIPVIYSLEDIKLGEKCLVEKCASFNGNIETKAFTQVQVIEDSVDVIIGNHNTVGKIVSKGSVAVINFCTVGFVYGFIGLKGYETIVHKQYIDGKLIHEE